MPSDRATALPVPEWVLRRVAVLEAQALIERGETEPCADRPTQIEAWAEHLPTCPRCLAAIHALTG